MSVKDNLGGSAIEGNATASQVLSGKTFMSESADELQTGTMANKGAWSQTVTPSASAQEVVVPEGYHNGSGKVTVNAGVTTVKGSAKIGLIAGTNRPESYVKLNVEGFKTLKTTTTTTSSAGRWISWEGVTYNTTYTIPDGTKTLTLIYQNYNAGTSIGQNVYGTIEWELAL